MSLKMTFLGTGSAFTVGDGNFQSNILLQSNNDSLLIDAGTDIRRSLHKQGYNHLDIKNVYISHLHGDHVGGLEWLAITSYFDPRYQDKPIIHGAESVLDRLWTGCLAGGLSTLSNVQANLENYFHLRPVKMNQGFFWQNIEFTLVQMIHVYNNYSLMPCYGLMFHYKSTRIFITADTQFVPQQLMPFYQEADIIFHDCETQKKRTGVHAHYAELKHLATSLKQKMWLYHYSPGPLPPAEEDGFLGFVRPGQVFEF